MHKYREEKVKCPGTPKLVIGACKVLPHNSSYLVVHKFGKEILLFMNVTSDALLFVHCPIIDEFIKLTSDVFEFPTKATRCV